ncbi:MAG: phytanoyl-CoA dioxygenase family protein [Caulobacter sp.]
MVDLLAPTKVAPLDADLAATLDHQGYLLLRGAVPEAWREPMRAAFDAGVGPPEQWAVPRAAGWRHALVDLDPVVQRACRAPALLGAVARMLDGPFFFSQVEGREPLQDCGHQPLHRDGAGMKTVSAMIYLDPYGPENGATRVLSRHLDDGRMDESQTLVLSGKAGDILVFDADLPHGATLNRSGARRRSLLLSFMHEDHRDGEEACRAVRTVRMDTSEAFAP